MSTITVAIAGLGSRGLDAYGAALARMPRRAKVTAVADPNPERVQAAAQLFGLSPEQCFSTAEDMLAQPRLADAVLICTQDRQHVPQATLALRQGYHVLLEKPISPDLEQCKALLAVSRETGRKVAVCHVLRYAPFYRKVKEVLDSGVLGRLITVMGIENVGYWHQAHSFVRGNWRRSDETSPMFLAKCCHDMDLMVWLTGKTCLRLSSFGSLAHFRRENAPAGAAQRCLDGCQAKANCPYDAEKIYITNEKTGVAHGHTGWPCDILSMHPTEASIRQALQTGPYGRCVYFCDNDVVDHQVVNLEMEDGLTISFTMSAFTAGGGRYTNFMGTQGDMIANMAKNTVTVTPFGGKPTVYDFNLSKERMSGHAGGDSVLLTEFLDYIEGKDCPGITSLEASLESHFIAIAAEESRRQGGACLDMAQFR